MSGTPGAADVNGSTLVPGTSVATIETGELYDVGFSVAATITR